MGHFVSTPSELWKVEHEVVREAFFAALFLVPNEALLATKIRILNEISVF